MIDSKPGHVVGSRYRLLRVIGHGGMGVVWAAQDQTLDRMVAVKEVRPAPQLSEAERHRTQQRVLREARAAGGVASVAAVSVFDVFAEDDRSWIVMELLEVPTLADAIRDTGPLSVSATIAIAGSLLDALQAAHRAGVLHRDVKPGNVLLTGRGAVLGDFGIAHRDGDPAITTTGVVYGSPAYLAPERVRGESSGMPADLWGLGATLYAAVEGHPPFDRGEVLATLHATVSDPVPEPRRAGVFAPLLLRLLSKDPDARPTADETRELLSLASRGQMAGTMPIGAGVGAGPAADVREGPVDPGEPVHALPRRPPSPRPRRRGLLWATAALLLVAALVVAAVLTMPGLGGDPGDTASDTASSPSSSPSSDPSTVPDEESSTSPTDGPSSSDQVVPPPFESADLYDFARDLFDPQECFVPSPGRFPFSEVEPDIERLKCIAATAPYTATFWCKADLDGLLADRDLYLSSATGDIVPVTDPPAGDTTPVDGVQVAFNHTGSNNARVYWDSKQQLCAGELQAVDDDDLDAAVSYWAAAG